VSRELDSHYVLIQAATNLELAVCESDVCVQGFSSALRLSEVVVSGIALRLSTFC